MAAGNSHTSDWIQIAVTVSDRHAAEAESLLFDAGAASVTLRDAGDHPLHEPDPRETPIWPQVIVEGLFSPKVDRSGLIEQLGAAGLIDDPASLRVESLADRDWERAWMDDYQPMRFGQSLWICPSHLRPEEDWPVVIQLDPGLAFGSGTHPTTALCLEWIDGANLESASVIDYGCGSGILAIACARFGASRVLAVDHDPQALRATVDNARRNGVADCIETMLPDEFARLKPAQRRADAVVANVLARPLIDLAPELSACRRRAGALVLSGILPEQAAEVAAAYESPDSVIDSTVRDGWVRLVVAPARSYSE